MKKKEKKGSVAADKNERQPYRVRLPGFVTEHDIGLKPEARL